MTDETIFALATGQGMAGVAVIRISGSNAVMALIALTGRHPGPARRLVARRFCDPETGDNLDDGLAVVFPEPASFTGETVVEIHGHGGRAATSALLDALSRCSGLRLADPGEFSKRAVLNGKIDLTQAEAIDDLVRAETSTQRRLALGQLDGHLGSLYEKWRLQLLRLLALMEASIDFVEDDVPAEIVNEISPMISGIQSEISEHLDDGRRGERVRDGISIAIIGAPNVGKSSLLNALARRDVAIVSDQAGTTRDVIEVHLDLEGIPVSISDTAGLRESCDPIEQEGMARARQRAADAALRIIVVDATQIDLSVDNEGMVQDGDAIVVVNKCDRMAGMEDRRDLPAGWIAVSAHAGEGLDCLLSVLKTRSSELLPKEGQPVMTRARHRRCLEQCVEDLRRFGQGTVPELMAEDLRMAVRALGELTGRVDVEELLGTIFQEFCIGK